MTIKVIKEDLPGVLLLETNYFTDNRGFFMETYHSKTYRELGIKETFVQDNLSHSLKNIVRGLHYQLRHPQGKLLTVINGQIFDVAVDIRRGSPFFGKWIGYDLSAENKRQLYVPKGFAHGFCVLSETADVIYKCTEFYAPGDEHGLLWNDPEIGINWPVDLPILSEKDSKNPMLKDIPDDYLPVFE